jgi:hypothetical protein
MNITMIAQQKKKKSVNSLMDHGFEFWSDKGTSPWCILSAIKRIKAQLTFSRNNILKK